MFDFRLATVFCLGHRFSKQKMTRYANICGAWPPGPPGYACDCSDLLSKRRKRKISLKRSLNIACLRNGTS